MFEGFRARPVICGDDQQYPIDRQHAGQHVGQKAFMAGNIDKAELGAAGQGGIGEAQIDGEPAPLLLRQAVGIDPRQRTDQRCLAVIDVTCRRQDHGSSGIAVLRNSRRAPAVPGRSSEPMNLSRIFVGRKGCSKFWRCCWVAGWLVRGGTGLCRAIATEKTHDILPTSGHSCTASWRLPASRYACLMAGDTNIYLRRAITSSAKGASLR